MIVSRLLRWDKHILTKPLLICEYLWSEFTPWTLSFVRFHKNQLLIALKLNLDSCCGIAEITGPYLCKKHNQKRTFIIVKFGLYTCTWTNLQKYFSDANHMKHIIKYQSFLNNLHEGFVANIIKIFATCNRCGYKQISMLFKCFHQQENLHTNREIKDIIGV
jgi:hypothetical protein